MDTPGDLSLLERKCKIRNIIIGVLAFFLLITARFIKMSCMVCVFLLGLYMWLALGFIFCSQSITLYEMPRRVSSYLGVVEKAGGFSSLSGCLRALRLCITSSQTIQLHRQQI